MINPTLIQGGMGVAVSSWQLASRVAALGHLGVVSGTALDVVLARRLQQGDPAGDLRRALEAFPDQAVAGEVLNRYFVRGGNPSTAAVPWRSFNARSTVLSLESPQPQLESAFAATHHCSFWAAG